MIHNEKYIEGYTIHATDDELGKVDAFLFDDENWAIRYLVADTRKWLPGRKVLLSPISIQNINHQADHISFSLTKEQVKNSPDIDADQPVSRAQEVRMNQYFGWGNYWGAPGVWGPGFYPYELAQQEFNEMTEEEAEVSQVRKTSEVIGYRVFTYNGEAGEIDSFLIDDKTWKIRYVVIRSKIEGEEKFLLVSTDWITDVRWADESLHISVEKESLVKAPAYHPDLTIDRDYEESVFKAFNKPPYWME
ncbi:PRC-barrel domain-containing protein [Halobacillus dabanensis]|uniref:PRC-barrel domain-containing protein n=1 Tax=Halobacillus dabanensis TaxID=240302 RepID=A0A1I3UGC9_HALDA|nr:PRC-barrel domain-containing protein [Halobacillus dabanensis]SFJ81749.1 PRC-barrel domain-containing protein [Halobacillus dabanensis]